MSTDNDLHVSPVLTFGVGSPPKDEQVAIALFDAVYNQGIRNLDTARSYTGSEELIGTLHLSDRFSISTKAPGTASGTGRGSAIVENAERSLTALKVSQVDTYLLHAPDPSVPVTEAVDAIQGLYREGRFGKFGLSNFSAEQVLHVYELCKKTQGGVLPTVYQGQYNLLCRASDTDLLPTLRSLNIKFQAYSPLCGGLFVKDPAYILQPPTDGTAGRWEPSFWYGGLAQKVFNKPGIIRFLEELDQLAVEMCQVESASNPSTTPKSVKISLAYRWLMYHSNLDGSLGDELVFANNTVAQFHETMGEVAKGKLPEWVVERLNLMWERVREESPPHDYLAYGLP